ncbi:hypothetical protein ACLKA7_008091 [Drosophila subpalustris]
MLQKSIISWNSGVASGSKCRRKDSSALQRSASIDSFAEIVFCDLPRPSLDIPYRNTMAASTTASMAAPTPFSKRPSASSLYSTCSSIAAATAAAASSQVHAQLNVNYGELAGGAHPGNGGSGGSANSSRRESMLSPSSTRRNKLTRIINDLNGTVNIISTNSIIINESSDSAAQRDSETQQQQQQHRQRQQ